MRAQGVYQTLPGRLRNPSRENASVHSPLTEPWYLTAPMGTEVLPTYPARTLTLPGCLIASARRGAPAHTTRQRCPEDRSIAATQDSRHSRQPCDRACP